MSEINNIVETADSDKHKRLIILDTETTGINPKEGHRIVEIGCVEMINRHAHDQPATSMHPHRLNW